MITRLTLWVLSFEIASLVLATQPSASLPIEAPLRELPWAQLNFLHTTDTHGWHAGHLLEPSFSADWGDYIAFSDRLHERADKEGVDLLLIDSGDRIDGNGLYDASRPKGKYDLDIFAEQHIDLICSGNHELYRRASVEYEYNTTVPNFKDNYIASNLDVLEPGSGERQPLAQRYKKFTTKNQGIRILAFGFLFNFKDGAENIYVQRVEDTIKEKWFQDAIRDRDVDLFIVNGHVVLDSPEYDAIYKAVRSEQWDVPIQFFGGHSHIRDYARYDGQAYAIQSGRYLETIGFMSINGLNAGGKKKAKTSSLASLWQRSDVPPKTVASPTFSRRYIDNNLYSFRHHTSLNASTFPTPHGLNVSAKIATARKSLDLDKTFGCAPQPYWTNRAPFPSPFSIFTLLQDQILPSKVYEKSRSEDQPRIVIVNTGCIRFDIFKGHFTVDTMYTVSPFASGFRFLKDVPYSIAALLLRILNGEVPQAWAGEDMLRLRAKMPVSPKSHAASLSLHSNEQKPIVFADTGEHLIPGYTTHDAGGADGDDTIHLPIQFYGVPNCIESRVGIPDDADDGLGIDVIYNEFLEKYVLLALKFLGTEYNESYTESYMGGQSMTELIGEWVEEKWPCEEGK